MRELDARTLEGALKAGGRKGRGCEPIPAALNPFRDNGWRGVEVGGGIGLTDRRGVSSLVDEGITIALGSSTSFGGSKSSSISASHNNALALAAAKAAAEGRRIPTFSLSGDGGVSLEMIASSTTLAERKSGRGCRVLGVEVLSQSLDGAFSVSGLLFRRAEASLNDAE